MIDYSRLEQAIFDGITRALAADRENARNERAAMEQCQAKAKRHTAGVAGPQYLVSIFAKYTASPIQNRKTG